MEHKITIGNLLRVKRGFLKGELMIMYCGMPNDNIFVLSPYMGTGYHGYSPNIFYDAYSKNIELLGLKLNVLEVNSEYIILKEIPTED